jgi:hypothetical protein
MELKPSYYRQAVKNVRRALTDEDKEQKGLFETATPEEIEAAAGE